MFCFGSGRSTWPASSHSSCMNTRFQISVNRSSSTFGPPSAPYFAPRSTKISEHGPHGPAVCIHQKFAGSPCSSNLPRRTIRSGGIPTASAQIWAASSSSS
jgi:hypothetical protein